MLFGCYCARPMVGDKSGSPIESMTPGKLDSAPVQRRQLQFKQTCDVTRKVSNGVGVDGVRAKLPFFVQFLFTCFFVAEEWGTIDSICEEMPRKHQCFTWKKNRTGRQAEPPKTGIKQDNANMTKNLETQPKTERQKKGRLTPTPSTSLPH